MASFSRGHTHGCQLDSDAGALLSLCASAGRRDLEARASLPQTPALAGRPQHKRHRSDGPKRACSIPSMPPGRGTLAPGVAQSGRRGAPLLPKAYPGQDFAGSLWARGRLCSPLSLFAWSPVLRNPSVPLLGRGEGIGGALGTEPAGPARQHGGRRSRGHQEWKEVSGGRQRGERTGKSLSPSWPWAWATAQCAPLERGSHPWAPPRHSTGGPAP